MNHKFRILGLAMVLSCVAMLPLAKADEVNKETLVTINAPVEVPGRVLPAGQYVFKLADSQVNRNIVQIFNADQTQIMATVLTVPTTRLKATDDSAITLEERSNGEPEAITNWFFGGETDGVQFIY